MSVGTIGLSVNHCYVGQYWVNYSGQSLVNHVVQPSIGQSMSRLSEAVDVLSDPLVKNMS